MKAESLNGRPLMCVRPFHWETVNIKSQGPVNIKDPAYPVHGPSKTQPRHTGRCPRTCSHFLSL